MFHPLCTLNWKVIAHTNYSTTKRPTHTHTPSHMVKSVHRIISSNLSLNGTHFPATRESLTLSLSLTQRRSLTHVKLSFRQLESASIVISQDQSPADSSRDLFSKQKSSCGGYARPKFALIASGGRKKRRKALGGGKTTTFGFGWFSAFFTPNQSADCVSFIFFNFHFLLSGALGHVSRVCTFRVFRLVLAEFVKGWWRQVWVGWWLVGVGWCYSFAILPVAKHSLPRIWQCGFDGNVEK